MIEMQEVESYLIHESTISDHDLVECLWYTDGLIERDVNIIDAYEDDEKSIEWLPFRAIPIPIEGEEILLHLVDQVRTPWFEAAVDDRRSLRQHVRLDHAVVVLCCQIHWPFCALGNIERW